MALDLAAAEYAAQILILANRPPLPGQPPRPYPDAAAVAAWLDPAGFERITAREREGVASLAAIYRALFDALRLHGVVSVSVAPGSMIGHGAGDPITGTGTGTGTIA